MQVYILTQVFTDQSNLLSPSIFWIIFLYLYYILHIQVKMNCQNTINLPMRMIRRYCIAVERQFSNLYKHQNRLKDPLMLTKQWRNVHNEISSTVLGFHRHLMNPRCIQPKMHEQLIIICKWNVSIQTKVRFIIDNPFKELEYISNIYC